MFRKPDIYLFLMLLFAQAACRYSQHPVSTNAIQRALVYQQAEVDTSSELIVLPAYDTSQALYRGLHRQASVVAFYNQVNNAPVWIESGTRTPTPLADSMMNFIANIRYYGLLRDHYHHAELVAGESARAEPSRILRRDVLLTDAFFSVANDLHSGRLRAGEEKPDSVLRVLLLDVLKDGKLKGRLGSLEPRLLGYVSLRKKLGHLLDSLDAQQRRILLSAATNDSIKVHRDVQALEINMERWKWEKNDFGNRFILVNIPSFYARVVQGDSIVLESKVIVGKPANPTPQVTSVIKFFETYPYWHVPRKIAVNELLPIIQRDRGYVNLNHFDVLGRKGQLLDPDSVDWNSFHSGHFPVTLRQREGPDNSLGILKFVFENPYAVFLHDTNAPRLFRNKVRAFSHGCIRMEKAITFAHYLLTGDVNKHSLVLDKYLKQATRHYLDVPNPIPIYVRYFTAEVRDGKLTIYNDLYHKDRWLISQLYAVESRYYY